MHLLSASASPSDTLTLALLRLRRRWPSLHTLVLLSDIILDRSVPTVATNGQDLLVNPDAVPLLTEDELQTALLAAVLDGAYLHAERPDGVAPLVWNLTTGRRTQQALHAIGATTWTGICWSHRLGAPPPGVDLGQHWGLVRCLGRQLAFPERDRSLAQTGLALEGPCLVCEAGGHERLRHPHLDAILRGSPYAGLPSRAMDCFRLVCDLTRPELPVDQVIHGLEWLAQCDSELWLQAAVVRICSRPEGKGAVAVAIQQNALLKETVRRSLQKQMGASQGSMIELRSSVVPGPEAPRRRIAPTRTTAHPISERSGEVEKGTSAP